MASEFVNIGDAIEGNKVEIYTRKEIWKGLRIEPMTGKLMQVYELDRNCSAEITSAVILSEDECEEHNKYALENNMTIHRTIGDKLKALAITVYIDTKKHLTIDVKEGLTSTHGGHLISCPKYTFAVIKYPFAVIASKFLPANQLKNIDNKTID